MTLITWDNSFSVKVKEIDEQHQKPIGMINELHAAMKSGQGKDKIKDIIDGMLSYVEVHFATEEKYFDQFNFELAIEHKRQHKDFKEKTMAFKQDYDSGKKALSIEVMKFLQKWLTDHIKGSDKKYTLCFNEHGLH